MSVQSALQWRQNRAYGAIPKHETREQTKKHQKNAEQIAFLVEHSVAERELFEKRQRFRGFSGFLGASSLFLVFNARLGFCCSITLVALLLPSDEQYY